MKMNPSGNFSRQHTPAWIVCQGQSNHARAMAVESFMKAIGGIRPLEIIDWLNKGDFGSSCEFRDMKLEIDVGEITTPTFARKLEVTVTATVIEEVKKP